MKAGSQNHHTSYSSDDSHYYRLVDASEFVPCYCVSILSLLFYLITFRYIVARC